MWRSVNLEAPAVTEFASLTLRSKHRLIVISCSVNDDYLA
jgi:hypothetical protein